MRSVKHNGKLATALLIWQKCLCGKKPFMILNAYMNALSSYSFSFDPSLWWPLLLSLAALKGQMRFHTLHLASHIT